MFTSLTLFATKITFWIVLKLTFWVLLSVFIISICALIILAVVIIILSLFRFIEFHKTY